MVTLKNLIKKGTNCCFSNTFECEEFTVVKQCLV